MDHLTITPQSVGSGGEQHVSSVNTEMIEFVVCKMFVFSCYENASYVIVLSHIWLSKM